MSQDWIPLVSGLGHPGCSGIYRDHRRDLARALGLCSEMWPEEKEPPTWLELLQMVADRTAAP